MLKNIFSKNVVVTFAKRFVRVRRKLGRTVSVFLTTLCTKAIEEIQNVPNNITELVLYLKKKFTRMRR